MSRIYREVNTPWSFVLPIAFVVMIGALSADVVRLMVAGVMARVDLQELNESLLVARHVHRLPSGLHSDEP